jgi:hypothetical protein
MTYRPQLPLCLKSRLPLLLLEGGLTVTRIVRLCLRFTLVVLHDGGE